MNVRRLARTAAKRLLPHHALEQLRWVRAHWEARRLTWGKLNGPARPHGLTAPLLVSLTSYPARFPVLHLTLRSLLSQTVAPDRIFLWIAEQDMEHLPRKVLELGDRGITIRSCEDVRSYKKLVFALEENPDAFIAIADDDMYYDPIWLEQLVEGFDPAEPTIVCCRAHRLRLGVDGRIADTREWEWTVADERSRRPSVDVLPTGCAGVLYPPRSLHPDVLDRGLFQQLSPTADDLWFYWMARRANSKHKVAGQGLHWVVLPVAYSDSLFSRNVAGENDRQIRLLEQKFGNPLYFGTRPEWAMDAPEKFQ